VTADLPPQVCVRLRVSGSASPRRSQNLEVKRQNLKDTSQVFLVLIFSF